MSEWDKGYRAGIKDGKCRFNCRKEQEAWEAGYKAACRTTWEALHSGLAYKDWKEDV